MLFTWLSWKHSNCFPTLLLSDSPWPWAGGTGFTPAYPAAAAPPHISDIVVTVLSSFFSPRTTHRYKQCYAGQIKIASNFSCSLGRTRGFESAPETISLCINNLSASESERLNSFYSHHMWSILSNRILHCVNM